ncbi:hypothetical protein A5844_000164 [Enterococcus sp. 10A9_DIV0425]|uniref:PTS EIIA type-2 domain-containing protein n=1 Tax=Candidatus Enterococcus wittei TaxID=1987383 RepID=A0A2C9XP55_9ENTE|nr:PTS sugar transporter subunit IIA [Enterococcus sp. 10A9_DIV0425]OTP11949.1 hypothetical protein A5844_000164 [Enterococcus sp. 10A9_DIV0425]THE16010.1 PTS sugar transporter subunit IIA [Enterococcus hirae]
MEFTLDNILLNCHAKEKKELLSIIADHAERIGVSTDSRALFTDFIAREEEGMTGLQDGFAIPHAKSSAVNQVTVFYVRNESVLFDWETFDEQGVKHIFALLVPIAEQGTKHIEMLSKLATALMEDHFKQKVSNSMNEQELADVIEQAMNGVEVE